MTEELMYRAPLEWPVYVPSTLRERRYVNSSFKHDLALDDAVTYLEDELRDLPFDRAVIFSNFEHLNVPRLRQQVSNDIGICVQLVKGITRYYITCDQWSLVEQNLYSIHLLIRSVRNAQGWGVGDIFTMLAGYREPDAQTQQAKVRAAANGSGTVDASAPGPDLEEWQMTLGLGPTATYEDARAVYRRRAKLAADDMDELQKLNISMQQAERALRG